MSLGNSIFSDVIEWFLGRAGDRRQYQRRAGAFHVWWLPDASKPSDLRQGIGMEISANGLVFIIRDKIEAKEFNLIIRLREQRLPIRCKNIRTDTVQHKNDTWNRHSCEFAGIAADHWDAVVRYVTDTPEPVDRRTPENPAAAQTDDAYRLLPVAIQNKIVATLVASRKLDEPKPGQTPLIKIFYGGLVNSGGKKAHRFNVHSRVQAKDEMLAYDTRFLVTEEGDVKQA